MKVGVITQYFPTSVQPWQGHSALQTLRVLAASCDVKVFYPAARYPAFLRPRTALDRPLDPHFRPCGIDVAYIPYATLPVLGRPLNGWAIARALLPEVRRFAPDVLLNYVVYPDGFAATRIARTLGVPVVLTAIGSDLNRIADPLCRRETQWALRNADFVTTVSSDLCRTAIRLGAGPGRSTAILNGCDTAVFHPRDREEARRSLGQQIKGKLILYVGRLDLRKGLMELVEAMSKLSSSQPNLRCVLLGSGPDKPALEAAVQRLGLEKMLHFHPAQPTETVSTWMAASDLVTLPSYNEGCPNVVLEALASGRPVVATRVGGIPEILDEGSGRLVSPRDVDELAAALAETLTASWNGAEIATRHGRSWSDVASELHTLLQSVASGRAAGES